MSYHTQRTNFKPTAINATVSIYLVEGYQFGERELGIFYTSGIIGTFIGWLIGHWMHDMVGRIYARRHNGHIEPEARLWVVHIASALLFTSILVSRSPLPSPCLGTVDYHPRFSFFQSHDGQLTRLHRFLASPLSAIITTW